MRNAFTLVELLVVMAIVVVLLALLTPALDRAITAAEEVKCATIQRQMGMANSFYATDFKGQYVPIKFEGAVAQLYTAWPLNRHYKSLLGITDPPAGDVAAAPGPLGELVPTTPDGLNSKLLDWPRAYGCPTAPVVLLSTGATWKTMGFNWSGVGADFNAHLGVRKTRIKTPADKAQSVDLNDWHTQGITPSPAKYPASSSANYTTEWDMNREATNSTKPGMVTYRHREGANIAHFDVSVRYYRKEEAWKAGEPYGANARKWLIYD